MLLKNPMGQWWNQRGNQKIPRDKWKQKHNFLKSMGRNKSSSKREVHSNTDIPQEIRKITNNLIYHKKELEKKVQTKPKVNRRKEITKVKNEIKQRLKKPIEKINETKRFFEKINKFDKLLARLTKKKREGTQIKKEMKEGK